MIRETTNQEPKFRKELKRKKVAKAMARAGKGVGGAKD